MVEPWMTPVVARQPYPLVFVTLSGAHLYGFASADSDFDLRGMHVLPPREVLGLNAPRETIEWSGLEDGREVDLVSHDAAKFVRMMLKRNGYVLEQLHSPLVVHTTPEHAALRALGKACVTRHHAHHYLGFAETQWRLFEKATPRRIKPLLCVYRVLMTGIHLMHTGEIDANLSILNESHRLAHVAELIAQKRGGGEQDTLPEGDFSFHEREYARLTAMLHAAQEASTLPEATVAKAGFNELLLRLRGVV